MKVCNYCGAEFTPASNAQKYCSVACKKLRPNTYEKTRYKYVKKPKAQYSPAVVKCLRCSRDFKSWDKRLNRICKMCSITMSDICTGAENHLLQTMIY